MGKAIITWKSPYINKDGQVPTHKVSSIHVDSHSSFATVVIEQGANVEVIKISMEKAQEIGFIDVTKLIEFCKTN